MMKQLMIGILALVGLLLLAACGQNEISSGDLERVPVYEADGGLQTPPPTDTNMQAYEPTGNDMQLAEVPTISAQPPSYQTPGRVVIVTEPGDQNLAQYLMAAEISHNHGSEKVLHLSYPAPFGQDRAGHAANMAEVIIQDPDVRVLVINPSDSGDYLAALVRAQRSDIFIVYTDHTNVNPNHADLVLGVDMLALSSAFVTEAHRLGADAIVYFAPNVCVDDCHALQTAMAATAGSIGINFVVVVDEEEFVQCGSSAHIYLETNIPLLIAEHGRNIALAGFDDERLLWSFSSHGTIYPGALMTHPTPQFIAQGLFVPGLQGFEREEWHDKNNLAFIISETRQALAAENLNGRLSAWPVSPAMLFNYAAVEYGIRWMNAQVSQNGVDTAALDQIMTGFIATYAGVSGLGVNLDRSGNTVLMMMDFMTY